MMCSKLTSLPFSSMLSSAHCATPARNSRSTFNVSLFGAGRRQQRSRRAEICILGLSKAEKMKITIVMRRSMRNFNTPSPREFLWEFELEHRSIQIIPRSSQNFVQTSYLKYLPKRQIWWSLFKWKARFATVTFFSLATNWFDYSSF